MKVKKYSASTMTEAMKQVKDELGHDAVILNSKVLYKGGFLGFFKKKSFEVIAAMDPEPTSHRKEKKIKEKKIIAAREFSVDYTNEKKEEQKILQEILQTLFLCEKVSEQTKAKHNTVQSKQKFWKLM